MYNRFKEIFKTDNRIFGLDLMRFVAIILVIMGHSRWMTASFPKPMKAIFYGSGILGVELFFVLSGFLIGGILLKQFEKNNFSLNFAAIKNFWVRRWLRTLPNYYLVLIIYILIYVIYLNDGPNALWRYFFFMQNIWNAPHAFFEESWSLCIEEISYLISPLILALSTYLFGKNKRGTATNFLGVSIFLIVVITILRILYAIYFLTPGKEWAHEFREVALIRLDAIYYGFIVAYIAYKHQTLYAKFSIPTFIIGCIGIIILMIFQKNITDEHASLISNTFFTALLSICIAFTIPYLSNIKTTKFQFIAKPITAVSIISYSLYLINNGLIAAGFYKNSDGGKNWDFSTALCMYGLYWFLCLSISTIIFVFFEKPMTDLRNKF